jgi:Ca-activated chloride channel family protein
VIKCSLIFYVVVGVVCAALWGMGVGAIHTFWMAVTGRGDTIFLYPAFLLLMLPIPPLTIAALLRFRQGRVAAMVYTRGALLAKAPRTLRGALRWWPTVLRGLGVLALCFAVARPQVATQELREVEGIDIYLVLDMSGSMRAIDQSIEEVRYLRMQGLSPQNRFEIARDVLGEFVERRRDQPWSDRLGMVLFARQAFLQFPLTIDYETVLWLLERLQINDIDPSQTAIGNALGKAVVGLIANEDENNESRIIILITDGDERGGNISAFSAAQVAGDEGIQIFPILVGRSGRVTVPAERSDFVPRYFEHEYPVDPELLQRIADETGGRFFRATDRESLETTLEEIIQEYDTIKFEDMVHHDREEVFFPFVWAGLFLIGLDLLISYGLLRRFP